VAEREEAGGDERQRGSGVDGPRYGERDGLCDIYAIGNLFRLSQLGLAHLLRHAIARSRFGKVECCRNRIVELESVIDELRSGIKAWHSPCCSIYADGEGDSRQQSEPTPVQDLRADDEEQNNRTESHA